MGELESNCTCAFQEKSRLCPVHWRESPLWGGAESAPRIDSNALGQFVILHPTFPLAWSGKLWVPAINGLPVGGVQICNFKTAIETLSYVNTHSEEIKAQLGKLAEDIAKQIGGGEPGRPADHWSDPPPDPNAFRCPFCGSWRPPYGISGQRANVPDKGPVEFMIFYCGVCRVVIAINITANPVLSVMTGAGFRKH